MEIANENLKDTLIVIVTVVIMYALYGRPLDASASKNGG